MLAAVILAGGKSSRMGTDKSLLMLPDSQQSLLEHCQQTLALLSNCDVFVSGSQHQQGIADVIPDCGPLSGIHGVISHIKTHRPDLNELLVLAVDMPDISFEDLSHLLQTGRKSKGLCCFENYYLPLYIPLSKLVTEYLSSRLELQFGEAKTQTKIHQYSIKSMLDSLNGFQIKPLKETQLDNINTPVQWQQRCAQPP